MSDDETADYLFSDPRPERVDFLGMVPAFVLADHDREIAAKAWSEGFIARLGYPPLYTTSDEWGNPYRAFGVPAVPGGESK